MKHTSDKELIKIEKFAPLNEEKQFPHRLDSLYGRPVTKGGINILQAFTIASMLSKLLYRKFRVSSYGTVHIFLIFSSGFH